MSLHLAPLRQIRSADLEISSLEADLNRLRKGLRDCDDEVTALQARVAKIEASVRHRQSQLKMQELDVAKQREDLEHQKTQLKNSKHLKDYHTLNAQVGAQTQNVSKAETLMLKGMEEIEALQKQKVELEAKQKEVASRRAALEAGTQGEASKIEGAIKEHRQQRGVITQTVDKELLEDYERLYARFGADALVACEDGACSGCYKDLTANLIARLRHGAELIRCPNCGRIMVEEKTSAPPAAPEPVKKKGGKKA